MGICNDNFFSKKNEKKNKKNDPQPVPKPKPPKNPLEELIKDYSKQLDDFMKKIKFQKYLSGNKEDSLDESFKELKKFESEELTKFVIDKYIEYIKTLDMGKLTFVFDEKDLIEKIINNEKSISFYKEKIFNEIEKIKNDDVQYKIEHLTILLIGRKGVGKTTLINYILKIDDNEEIITESISNDFVSYKSRKVPHLKLIEFKGIGLDINSDPETIGNKALNCIQNEIKKKGKDYNDFIHCIWYCVSDTRFEGVEANLL